MHEPAHLSRRGAIASAISIAALAGATTAAASAVHPTVGADPVFAQIGLHKLLRDRANNVPWPDDDPLYQVACADEEAAIQALGDMVPTTLLGAAAQLAYMAEVEEAFADDESPLLRCVVTVARALAGGLAI